VKKKKHRLRKVENAAQYNIIFSLGFMGSRPPFSFSDREFLPAPTNTYPVSQKILNFHFVF